MWTAETKSTEISLYTVHWSPTRRYRRTRKYLDHHIWQINCNDFSSQQKNYYFSFSSLFQTSFLQISLSRPPLGIEASPSLRISPASRPWAADSSVLTTRPWRLCLTSDVLQKITAFFNHILVTCYIRADSANHTTSDQRSKLMKFHSLTTSVPSN